MDGTAADVSSFASEEKERRRAAERENATMSNSSSNRHALPGDALAAAGIVGKPAGSDPFDVDDLFGAPLNLDIGTPGAASLATTANVTPAYPYAAHAQQNQGVVQQSFPLGSPASSEMSCIAGNPLFPEMSPAPVTPAGGAHVPQSAASHIQSAGGAHVPQTARSRSPQSSLKAAGLTSAFDDPDD